MMCSNIKGEIHTEINGCFIKNRRTLFQDYSGHLYSGYANQKFAGINNNFFSVNVNGNLICLILQ